MENLFRLNFKNQQLYYEKPLIYSYNFNRMWVSILVAFVVIFLIVFSIGWFTKFEIGNIFFIIASFSWCFIIVSMGGFLPWSFKFNSDQNRGEGYLLSFYKNYGKFDKVQEKELKGYSIITVIFYLLLSIVILFTVFEFLYQDTEQNPIALAIVFSFLLFSSIHFLYKIYYFEMRGFIYDHLIWDKLPQRSMVPKKILENKIVKNIIELLTLIYAIIMMIAVLYGLFHIILWGINYWSSIEYSVNDFWMSRKISEIISLLYDYFLGFLGINHEQLMYRSSLVVGFLSLVYFFASLFHFTAFSISTKEKLLSKRFSPSQIMVFDKEEIIPALEMFQTSSSESNKTTPSDNYELKKLKHRIAIKLVETKKLRDEEIIEACFISEMDLKEIKENLPIDE